jgi:hypothetical protein
MKEIPDINPSITFEFSGKITPADFLPAPPSTEEVMKVHAWFLQKMQEDHPWPGNELGCRIITKLQDQEIIL